jgi:biotin transport system permease protein
MLSLYVPGDSVVHRVPAALKLFVLVIGSMALFVISNIPLHVAELLVIAVLFQVARLSWKDTLRQLRTALIFMVPIFLFHAFLTDWILGLETILRILVLLLLAILITLTTKVSDMMDVLEWATLPLKPLGVNPSKVSMMLSMVIRFIPMMMREAQEILEAQRARGLERNAIALLMPLLIKTLKMADDLSEAIEARAYDPERVIPVWKRRM